MTAVGNAVRELRCASRTHCVVRRAGAIVSSAAVIAIGIRAIVDFDHAQRSYTLIEVAVLGAIVALVIRLYWSRRAADGNAAAAMHAYVQAQLDFENRDRANRQRLHDARSALAGVRGAVQLLGRQTNSATGNLHLHRLLSAELERMRALLDTDLSEPAVDFDLTEALNPVIDAHRIAGTHIDITSWPARAHGRPYDTASAVDNLLRNARVHAPGAHVTIRIARADGRAVVVVDDDGPGIPLDECGRVLLPGVRGSSAIAPGSGLGLYSAATLMETQGGALQVTPRESGGTRIVLELPAASPHLSLVDKLAG